jgi:NTE family protein
MAINVNTQLSKSLCDVLIEPPGLGRYSGFEIAKAREIFDFAYTFTKENYSKENFVKAVA